jgi:hypothetical protein
MEQIQALIKPHLRLGSCRDAKVDISDTGEFLRGRELFRRDRIPCIHGVAVHRALRGQAHGGHQNPNDRDECKFGDASP